MLLKLQLPSNTMLKPCPVWFLLPWAEMHINTFYNLAECQGMVFPVCSPDGLDSCLNWWSSWRKASKAFGPATRTVSRLARPPPLLLLSPASSPLLLTHAQTHFPEHRDTIQRRLWAQFVCFNGQEEAPDLTTGRPRGLWTHEEITVKSHQGFNSLWPSRSFPLALGGALVCG